jgi:hypothetical protein
MNIMKHVAILKAKCFSALKLQIFILCSVFIGQACAQSAPKTQGRFETTIPAMNPVMKISNLQKDEANPMKIDELIIDIKVLGQIAVTTMEFTYFNTNARVMEGEFSFPLAEGQTVSRFALDINGQMREGVVVEKEQGRKTFEAIVRRGVDPGLLEKTVGNNFKARVYPLPANGYRKVIIAYEQELTDKGEGYLYQLPLKIEGTIKNFQVHAEVIKQQVKFNIDQNELSNFEFKHWIDSYIADYKMENYLPNKQLAFLIPNNNNTICYTESFKNNSDSSWFYFNFKPKQFDREKILPKKIAVFWDNSNSCSTRDIEKELAVIDGYLKKIGNVQIELIPFNIKAEKSKTFIIINGKWDELRKALSDMDYDGGTSYGNIDFSKYNCDEILLCSDGISNFGSSIPVFSKAPIMVINSNTIANHSLLTFISQCSGGLYLNLTKTTTSEAIGMLCKSDYHFISAKIVQGNVTQLYPSTPVQFQNTFSQAGVLKGKSATILLNFGFGNTIVYTEKIDISADKSTNTGILRRVWAEKKLASLSINEEANKEEITRLGKEYGIVTSNTSLIVLENMNDYWQYHIVPPKEMQSEYFSHLKNIEQTETDKIKNHIDYVAGLFDSRIKWWNMDYPKKELYTSKYQVPVVDDTVYEQVSLASIDEMADAAPNAVVSSEDKIEEVVVVGYGTQRRSDVTGSIAVVNESSSAQLNKAKKEDDGMGGNNANASIQLNAWDPQTPYLKVMQYSVKGQEYETYLKLKKEYGSTPFFFIDASDFFAKAGLKDIALKVLTNLAELKLEEPGLLRILGKKLQPLNCKNEAVDVFKKVVKLKGEEPQSYRDLGLAYEANGQYQLAITSLYEVVKRDWDGRFPQIEVIALEELNNIIANHKSSVDYSFVDKRLVKDMPLNIRVVLTWDTDNCDMDLWVTDPSGEKCFYSHQNTRIGGLISCDFTQGYGPEEFLLKKAMNGEYKVQANYYGTRSQTTLAPVTLHLTFFTNYGKPNQQMQETTIRLENKQDVIDIGKFAFGKM